MTEYDSLREEIRHLLGDAKASISANIGGENPVGPSATDRLERMQEAQNEALERLAMAIDGLRKRVGD